MNVLVWHVHGSWMTAFVQGAHRYLVPVVADRGPDGLGRARTWDWPASVVEVTPEQLGDLTPADVDVVVLQRPRDLDLLHAWTGDRLRRTPRVWVEHDTPLALPDPRRRRARVRAASLPRRSRPRDHGRAARALALEHFSLARFLADWDRLLESLGPVGGSRSPATTRV